jgi:hypothetical protein
MTTLLDRVAPVPALVEVDAVDLAAPPARAWQELRHADLGASPLIRALFAVRTTPDRLRGHAAGPPTLRLDDLRSSTAQPGFQILAEDPGHEVVVGAIGKVWHLEIPFVHVESGEAFRAFSEPGFVKVAWAMRVEPLGEQDSRVTIEVRVEATDAASWAKFRRYFTVIGPGSHFIRSTLLASLAKRFGTPGASGAHEEARALPGDELLEDAGAQITRGVTIAAPPEKIWPWLVEAGDVLPATPASGEGFEVLAVQPNRALVLGALYDADAKRQRDFGAPRPEHYWHVTWAFYLEPIDSGHTRLHVRARAAFPPNGRVHAEWIRPVHGLIQQAQLRQLVARIEGRQPRDSLQDLASGAAGASIMVAALLTPFLRGDRSHWGLDAALAERTYPGDDFVPDPRWSWTHGIEIASSAQRVWPWIAQLGADRGGFYSYQALENVVGCNIRNADALHPEWAIREGDTLRLHPKMPPLRVAAIEAGRFFVVHAPADESARAEGKPWANVSWLFYLEPLGEQRCRLISRYRCATSDDLATRLSLGPALVEPIGFAMDRRMLLGVKARAETKSKSLRSSARPKSGARVLPKTS